MPLRPAARLVIASLLLLGLAASPAFGQPSISKVFNPSSIGPGSTSTAAFTITNGSGAPVTDLAFSDVLPAAVTIANPANASSNCLTPTLSAPAGGTTISLADASVPGSSSCTVTVDVTSSTVGAHTNPAITLTSSAGSTMSLPVDLTVTATKPGFTKSFSPSSVPLGTRSTLTLTIDNTANPSALSGLSFTDVLPSGLLIADPANAANGCDAGPNPVFTANAGSDTISLSSFGILFPGFEVLLAGATCTMTVDVVASTTAVLNNVTSDLIVVSGGPSESAGKASAALDVTSSPLTLIKAFVDDPVAPGAPVTLDFQILNRDRNNAASAVAFTDDLAAALAGLTFDSVLSNDCGGTFSGLATTTIGFSGGAIAAQGSCSISTSLTVPAGAAPGNYVNTTSAVSGTVGGSPIVGNLASDTLFVSPAPTLTKTFLADPVNPGDTVVLEFTVTNTSATSSATAIAFSDPLPTILPTASVTPGNDCCGMGSTCTFTPLINPPPPSDVTPANMEISGGTLAPAGMPGDSCTFSVTLDVAVGAGPGDYVNTTSDITATVDGATRTGEPASDTLTVVSAPILSKSFTDDPVAPGDTVTLEFTLEYPADASGPATDITFTDDLAPVLAGLTANLPPSPDPPCGAGSSLTGSAGDTLLTLMAGSLMPGEACAFSVTLDVPAAAAPGTYTNTTSGVSATVAGVGVTSQPVSDDLSIAGLDFAKEFVGDPVIAGDTVTLRFTIDNIHPTEDATGIFFTDNLPGALSGLAASGPATMDTCGGALSGTTFLVYTGGSLTSGSSCVIEVDVVVPPAAADGAYTNTTSSLTATQGGGVVLIDPAVDNLVVNSNLLQLDKVFTDDPVAPGDSVTLEFTLINLDAANAASAVGFTDDLAAALAGLTFDSVLFDDCGGTVSGTTTTTITVTGVSIAAGGSCTIRTSLSVPAAAPAGFYTNTTSDVTGMIDGFAVTGDPGSDILEVLNLLTFSKSFDGPTTATGAAVLTFTITNPGSTSASDIDFSDDLDAVISGLIATSLPAVPCGAGSSISGVGFLTMSGGSLPPSGGMCSFDVDVLVPASATGGTYLNTTSDLTTSGLKVSDPATADLTIEPPPTFTKVFDPDFIGLGQKSTLTFTIDNTASSLAASSLDFTDNLPAGVVVGTPTSTNNTCGGILTAVAGSSVITLTGGSVGAGLTCRVDVDVTGTAVGAHVNTSGDLTSSSGNSGTATDTLTVNPQPTFAKVFAPNPIIVGGVSTLTFVIDNTGSTVAATGLAFTDNLPASVIIATPANAANTCTGGTLMAVAAGSTISYVGGTASASASCSISIDVTSSTPGSHVNLTTVLSSSLGTSAAATDTLVVNPPPGFSKVFSPDAIASGTVSTLTFTVDNSASTVAATSLAFTDNLPVAVVVATPANNTSTCGGTLTAAAGTSVISLMGGTAAASASCTISVDVTSSTAGTHVNLTGDLTSNLGNSGTATDALTVDSPPLFSKVFAADAIAAGATSTLTFTIDNSAAIVLDATGLDFTDNLPASVVVATPANAATTCTGGTLTATAASTTITYTGGSVAMGSSCTISVDVTSSVAGAHVNTTGDLTSSLGNSGTASDTLTVDSPPLFSKVFAPDAIAVDGTSTLTFTIDNSAALALDATALDFTDNLPTDLIVATPANASTTCTGGVLTAVAASDTITYTGGSVTTASSCSVSVDVTSSSAGSYTNISGDLTSSLGNSGTATDTLTVDAPPLFTKVFDLDAIAVDAVSTLTFTIDNSASLALDASALDFTDNLPAAVLVATPANVVNTCTGGTVTAVSATSVIGYTGGSVTSGDTCTLSVDVTSSTAGSHVNLTGDLTSSLGNSGTATDTLTVDAPILFSKAFVASQIAVDDVTILIFTLDNRAGLALDATAVDFTDNMPAAILVATPAVVVNTCTGGTVTAAPGTSVISYTGGTVPVGTHCTISVNITSSVVGAHVNTTGDLTSSLGNSGTATDTLSVSPPPGFSKAFTPDTIASGDISSLEFTIDNSGATTGAAALDFTDNLPAGMVVATPANVITTCTGGTITAVPGTGVVSLSGATVAASSMCTLQVEVTATGKGDLVNTTGDLTSSLGNSGPATATLTVTEVRIEFSKVFLASPVLPGGFVDLEYTITNTSALFDATDIAFTDDLDSALSGLIGTTLPSDPCGVGSTLTGTGVLDFSGGTLAPGGSCTFQATLQVPGDAATGIYPSTTANLTLMRDGVALTAGAATADLEVVYLLFSKSFVSEPVVSGTTTPLTFTITNPDPVNTASGINFSDDLEAVIPGLVAIDLPLADVCGVGSMVDGTSLITLTGGVLAAGETCEFVVVLDVPGAASNGEATNQTSVLEATVGGAAVAGDPADVAVAVITILSNPIEVPTLQTWGLLLLSALLVLLAAARLRRS